MKSSTSLTLLQRLKSVEDTDAWTLANQLYSPLIARWARKAGLDDISADDVAQDVFMTLFREMPTFQYDKTKGKFRSWLKNDYHQPCPLYSAKETTGNSWIRRCRGR